MPMRQRWFARQSWPTASLNSATALLRGLSAMPCSKLFLQLLEEIRENSTTLEKMNCFSVMILIMVFLQCYAEREMVPQEPVDDCGPQGGCRFTHSSVELLEPVDDCGPHGGCGFKYNPVVPLDDEDCRSDGCRFKSPAADQ
ncbi:uncharacterized protein [Parasteatoda tepidariorum]|uniref:uncharacterized protein isoform X2 n=1 Tax=Parasteatoda tepidariorum TaxID=114398 RepID=UPI0039BC81E8